MKINNMNIDYIIMFVYEIVGVDNLYMKNTKILLDKDSGSNIYHGS